MLRVLESKASAAPGSEAIKLALVEAKRYKEQGADKPFLDVWFQDDKNGYVVGAYNLIFRTADGGRHWEPFDVMAFHNLVLPAPARFKHHTSGIPSGSR